MVAISAIKDPFSRVDNTIVGAFCTWQMYLSFLIKFYVVGEIIVTYTKREKLILEL